MWFGDPEQASDTQFITVITDVVETRAAGIVFLFRKFVLKFVMQTIFRKRIQIST